MIVRPAEPRDDEQLKKIESEAGQGNNLKIVNRRDSFFSRANQFEDYVLLVAQSEETGVIRGVMGASVLKLRIQDGEYLGAYMFDWRSNREANKGLSRAMYYIWREMESILLAQGVDFLYGFVKEDNITSASIITRSGTVRKGDKFFLAFPVYRRRYVSREVACARRVDMAEEYAEASRHYRDADLMPIMDDYSHVQALADECLVAKLTSGSSSMKIWDISHHMDWSVLHMPRKYEVLGSAVNALGKVIPLPKIPIAGTAFKVWNIYDVITPHSSREEVRALLAHANNIALDHGIPYLIVSVDGQSTELDWLRRASIMPLKYNLFVREYKSIPPLDGKTYYDIRYI